MTDHYGVVVPARGCQSLGCRFDSIICRPSHVTRLLWFIWLKVGTVYPQPARSISGHMSPMRPNEHWTCLDTEPPGLAPGCQRRYLLDPFEEEEEGSGIASDVINVKGKDPATPGSLRKDRGRRYARDSGKETWVHTPLSRS